MLKTPGISFGRIVLVVAALFSVSSLSQAQQAQPAITIAESSKTLSRGAVNDVPTSADLRFPSNAFAENYREFTRSKVGSSAYPEVFTLEFHVATQVAAISANHDFRVSGGTCSESQTYLAGDVCDVQVTFSPKGAGRRTGQLSIVHSASASPFLTPLGGTGYGPAVSFIPSRMATVPGTYTGTGSAAGGTLLSPQGLAVDGGDNLYIADTGNNLIKFRDSSGAITVFAGGGTASAVGYSGFGSGIKLTSPSGVAVDYSGTVFISDTGDSIVLVRYLDGIINTRIGGGSTTAGSCSYSSPCLSYNVKIQPPYSVATDSQGSVYITTQVGGSLPGFYLSELDIPAQVYYLLNTTAYNYYSTSSSLAVDASGNLIYTYEDPGGPLLSPTPLCYILAQNRAYSISASGETFWNIAGSGPCGFSGDGGKATGAEISTTVGQFAYDAAGNFYFADTGNNRIRRIDNYNGIIRTVAGSGTAGFGGDGGPSTSATIQTPTGIAVDSTGRVYTTGIGASATNPAGSQKADIRMFGTIGQLNFGNQAPSSHSAAQTVLISNVGNDNLDFTHTGFSSGNTGDFAVDPNTTTCNFTVPLYSGRSCAVGFIFSPSAVGARSAVFSLQDDTVEGVDVIQLSGSGAAASQAVLTPKTHAFPSRKVGTVSPAFAVTLSNSGGTAMTLNSFTFSGGNPGDFAQTNNCGSTLAASASCTINITYTPTAEGSRAAIFTVGTSANAPTVSLTGKATAAAVKPKVTLASAANPTASGKTVVLNSQVANGSSSGQNPTGQVQIKEGDAVLKTAKLTASGAVTFRLQGLAAGVHMLKAEYLGDASHTVATSTTLRQVVGGAVRKSR